MTELFCSRRDNVLFVSPLCELPPGVLVHVMRVRDDYMSLHLPIIPG